MILTTDVEVLGQTYSIKKVAYNEDAVFARDDIHGYCDCYNRTIVLCDYDTHPDWDNETDQDKRIAAAQLLRHEIIHAFLFESGLHAMSHVAESGWASDEEMVDWIALQFPKMLKAFRSVDVLSAEEANG